MDEVCSNLSELLLPATNMSSDPEGLIGRRIRRRWNVEGSEHWYLGTVLDIVPCTDDWQYDEEQVLSLNLKVDIDKGNLEFV